MTDDLEARVERLELAISAIGVAEFGDATGHPFHGNQHTGGMGTAYDPTKPIPHNAKWSNYEKMHGTAKMQEVRARVQKDVAGAYRKFRIQVQDEQARNPDEHSSDVEYRVMEDIARELDHEHAREFRRRVGLSTETLEFGDVAGHDFHGNQWTNAGGSDKYNLVIEPHPRQAGKVHVRLDEKNGRPNVDSRTVDQGQEANGVASLLRSYSTTVEAERAAQQQAERDVNTNLSPEQVAQELRGVDEQLREQGYSLETIGRDRVQRAFDDAKTDPWGRSVIKPPSGYEIGVTYSTLKEMLRR